MSYLDTFRERRKRRKTQRAIKRALKGFAKDQSKIKMLKEHIKTAGVVVNIIDYIEERGLTKVAKNLTPSATELSLKTNPTGYGIHAKREGVSHRGLAVTQGVPSAVVAGVPLGAIGGILTEGANANLLTEKGRKRIGEGYRKDLKTLGKGLSEDYLLNAAMNPKKEFAQYLASKMSGAQTDAARLGSNVGDVLKRRAALGGKGVLSGMALAGGIKGLMNLGQYEASRALAPHKEAKKRKRTRIRISNKK